MDRILNAALNASEFEAQKLVLKSSPTMVYIELTQNCNLHCVMCRSAGSFSARLNMPQAVFDTVMRDLVPLAAMVDLRGWGESTILPWFPERLRQVAATGARLRLVTNALNMADATWHTIFATNGVVVVSVDAATQVTSTALGRGDLKRVLGAVARGVSCRNRLGEGTLYFNTVVSSTNLNEIPAIVETAADLGVNKVVLSPIRTQPADPAHLGRVSERLPVVLERVQETAERRGIPVQLSAALHPSIVAPAGLPSVCANPWTDVVVSYNGDVIFCDHLIGHAEYATGNLTREPFRQIWNGPKFVRLRQSHLEALTTREVGVYSKCTWCYGNRYGDSEVSPGIPAETRRVWLARPVRT